MSIKVLNDSFVMLVGLLGTDKLTTTVSVFRAWLARHTLMAAVLIAR